jgi:hypothetical protein
MWHLSSPALGVALGYNVFFVSLERVLKAMKEKYIKENELE